METEELRRRIMEVIEYDPETGLFRWKSESKGTNKRHGWFSNKSKSDRSLQIFGKHIVLSHLAWMLKTGDWPDGRIGFHDGNSQNLNFCNLFLNRAKKVTRKNLTQSQLKEYIEYDGNTGLFRWRYRVTGNCNSDWFCGVTGTAGHLRINVFNTGYQAHQIAWFWTHGVWGEPQLDHIDGVKTNNRIDNLRVVNRQENSRNSRRSKRNTSGHTGVSINKKTGRWVSQIGVDRKVIVLGAFDSIEDAIAARKAAELKYEFHENHGKERSA